MRTKTQQDAIEQLVWRARALPVQVGSRLAPSRMVRGVAGARRVHLGCGDNLLDGWANLDMDGPAGVTRFDLLRPLPFGTGSVELVFSEHFIEHVTKPSALAVLRECHRILEPGGILRLSTPDLVTLLDEYRLGRTTGWTDLGWSPDSPCDMVNEAMRLWGHLYVWDEAELTKALTATGFGSVRRVAWHTSERPGLSPLEVRPDRGDLILEAVR